jgi:hypothetical protein
MNLLPAITFAATLVLGPGVFLAFCYELYRSEKSPKFPVWWGDGLGDFVFVPLFNAIAVEAGVFSKPVSGTHLVISIVCGGFIGIGFALYNLKSKHDDWSRRKNGSYNAGGWYHLICMIAEFTFVIYALLQFPQYIWLWIWIILYAAGLGVQVMWRRFSL